MYNFLVYVTFCFVFEHFVTEITGPRPGRLFKLCKTCFGNFFYFFLVRFLNLVFFCIHPKEEHKSELNSKQRSMASLGFSVPPNMTPADREIYLQAQMELLELLRMKYQVPRSQPPAPELLPAPATHQLLPYCKITKCCPAQWFCPVWLSNLDGFCDGKLPMVHIFFSFVLWNNLNFDAIWLMSFVILLVLYNCEQKCLI